jgi:hypothetical protein
MLVGGVGSVVPSQPRPDAGGAILKRGMKACGVVEHRATLEPS